MNVRSTRLALLGALALAAGACADIWGFKTFDEGSDASTDVPGMNVEGDDATMEEAGPPPDNVPEATVDVLDSPAPEEEVDARDAADAGTSPCLGGKTLCGGRCLDTTSDPAHCGGCTACTGDNQTCVASTCVCAAGFHMCNGICSSNLSTYSCGQTSCTVCAIPQNGTSAACTDAGCGTCEPGYTLCNANTDAADCVDFTTDPTNCGGCNTACHVPDAGGTPTCVASVCGLTCNAGLTACPAVIPTGCANLTNDIHNCGGCSKKCPAHDSGAAATCVDGGCH